MVVLSSVSLWVVEEVSEDHAKEFHTFDRESEARMSFCGCVQRLSVLGDIDEILDCFDHGRFDLHNGTRRWRDDIGNEVFMARAR